MSYRYQPRLIFLYFLCNFMLHQPHDRLAIIYHVLRVQVAHLSSFHAAAFPHSLAVASEAALTIGTADQLQKLHVRTVVLGEQPRRIAHHEAGRLLGVLTQRVVGGAAWRRFGCGAYERA